MLEVIDIHVYRGRTYVLQGVSLAEMSAPEGAGSRAAPNPLRITTLSTQ